jgi:hypothetical protein
MSASNTNITPREQNAILKSLAVGLVPEIGLHHLVVGRKQETQALAADLDCIKEGGASFRVITGANGSGKTFLQCLDRSLAIQSGLVVLSADLTVNHRLHATDGRGRALLASLMGKVCTKACPAGNGLRPLLESWISGVQFELGNQAATPEAMEQQITEKIRSLKDYVGGFEFAQVLARYYEGHANDNPALQDSALRWLRAEYSTKTEARRDLGVRRIISDEDIYPAVKLFSAFCRLAGYGGVVVMLDELSALTHRLPHAKARQANVQVLLTILNECLQGGASGLGFLLAGTPDALEDPERGLFTVPALRSRLQPCAPPGCIDYASPVLRLEPLGHEELLVLLRNVRRVHALGDESKCRLPNEALEQFLGRALSRFGRQVLANPRDVLRPFVSILNLLDQEPDRRWQDLIAGALADSAPAANAAEAELAGLDLR